MMAFFKQHGDPMTVARRYRQDHHSLSLGWELIGPELFPTYLMFLAFNLTLTIASGKAAVAFVNLIYVPMMHISGLFYPLPKFLRAFRRFGRATTCSSWFSTRWGRLSMEGRESTSRSSLA
jgi:hypothetical protein